MEEERSGTTTKGSRPLLPEPPCGGVFLGRTVPLSFPRGLGGTIYDFVPRIVPVRFWYGTRYGLEEICSFYSSNSTSPLSAFLPVGVIFQSPSRVVPTNLALVSVCTHLWAFVLCGSPE